MAALGTVTEPFPIFKLAGRYMLYDADTISYIRQKYNICGVFIGSLPQAPQQSVFLGLPLELLPEEARLLVEKNVAHVIDAAREHKHSFLGGGLSPDERRAYHAALRKQGQSAARDKDRRADDRKAAWKKKQKATENWNDVPVDMLKAHTRVHNPADAKFDESKPDPQDEDKEGSLFIRPPPTVSGQASGPATPTSEVFGITPTTSYPPLQSTPPAENTHVDLPEVTASYPLFKHLHKQGYFLSPGLRFGCQYTAYPGDPLRFHSHFLCIGMDWDQEFDLLDLVGGGRLGTGVKKGFLIGGSEEKSIGADVASTHDSVENSRAFCIEWAGM